MELSQSIEDDMRDAEGGWCNAFVECGVCGRRWVSVFPVEAGLQTLECPGCGQQGETRLMEDSE